MELPGSNPDLGRGPAAETGRSPAAERPKFTASVKFCNLGVYDVTACYESLDPSESKCVKLFL